MLMELKTLIQTFQKHLTLILGFGLVFGLLGAAFYYYYPKSYKAVGSFYVARVISETPPQGDFTYEGYYAQQAGTNYTETFIGLLESVDVRKLVLESMSVEVNEASLRRAARIVDARKTAPQIVTLTVKASDPESAKKVWQTFSNVAISTSAMNTESAGDPLIEVWQISWEPVVYETFNNLYVDILAGLAFGLLLGSFTAAFKEYLS